jgi:hypothetical protein
MKTQTDVILTGSDGPVEGIAKPIIFEGQEAYEFKSIDGTLHLIIAQDNNGQWQRLTGTYPYFTGWVDELVEQVAILKP